MHDETIVCEALLVRHRGRVVGERRLHESRVIEPTRFMRVALHRNRRWQVIREVQDVQQVRAPVAELARAVIKR